MNLDPIRIRELEASLEAHRLLLTNVSARAEDARGQLVRIGRELCGNEFDRFLGALGDLEYVSAEELASNVINALKNHSSTNPANGEKQIKDLQKEIEALKERLDKQTRRADDAERILSDSTNQVKVLEKNLMEETRKNKELAVQVKTAETPPETVNYSDWFEGWTQDINFERDRMLLTFIGANGISRQTEIKDRLEGASETDRRTLHDGLDNCVKAGLLERRPGPPTGGRPTDLVHLTDKGRWTYTHLTNSAPVPGEYEELLKAHKSDKQLGLIFRTADYFERLGFTVSREPQTIKLAGGHIFQPDLIVQKEEETFYLEVETGEKMDRLSLSAKWQNAMVVGGGRICVVAPRLGTMTTIQSNILEWARGIGKIPRLYLTHLDALRKLQKGDSPWVRIR